MEKVSQKKNSGERKSRAQGGEQQGQWRQKESRRTEQAEQRKNEKTRQQAQGKKKSSETSLPQCPVSRKCGGCRGFGMSYSQQLQKKAKVLEEQCGQFGKFEPIAGMKNPYHYRNKVHAVFGEDRRHNIISGIYEEGTHRIVPVDSCLLEDKKADEIIVSIRGMLKSFKIRPYNEDTGYGLFRHVLIRTGHATGEIMVVLVLASPILPSKNNFVKALLKLHPEITTIVLNVNNKDTSMILGEKETVLYGKGYIEDILLGKTFRISSRSFYQVNPVQTEKLYGTALEFAELSGEETVWDLYCGIGTISLFLAQRAKRVYGVEIVPEAVENAKENARLNGIRNAEFFCGAAEEVVPELAEGAQTGRADVVVVDPPRKGCDGVLLDTIGRMAPERIVYVSCDPGTLARDVKVLMGKGYEVRKVRACDMFGQGGHVESVCLLYRR